MKTLDRYILGKVLWPLSVALAIAISVLLLERLVRLLDLLVDKGGPLFLVLKMLTNLVPHYIGIAMPATFFIAVLLAVMRLNRDSELHAIQSAGIGLTRLVIPILGLAVVLMACSAFMFNYLQPYSRYAYRAVSFTLTHTAWNAAVESGSFFTGFSDKTVLVEGITEGGGMLSRIFVHKEKPSGDSITITAEEAQVFQENGSSGLSLRLYNGIRTESKSDDRAASIVTFDRFELPLDLVVSAEPFHERGGDEEELTLSELWAIWDDPPAGFTAARIGAEINNRLVRTLTILVFPFLAIPLGISSRRGRQGMGLLVGAVLLVLYHHILQFGHSLTERGQISPGIGLWLPFAVFTAFSLWSYHTVRKRPEENPLAATLVRIEDFPGVLLKSVSWLSRAK